MKETKKIAIDARPLSRKSGGIRRYLSMVLLGLHDDTNYELILYTDFPVRHQDLASV